MARKFNPRFIPYVHVEKGLENVSRHFSARINLRTIHHWKPVNHIVHALQDLGYDSKFLNLLITIKNYSNIE